MLSYAVPNPYEYTLMCNWATVCIMPTGVSTTDYEDEMPLIMIMFIMRK